MPQADEALDRSSGRQNNQPAPAVAEGRPRKVKALGGLRIIATERHESRRIDNQLRGARAGRATRLFAFLSEPGRRADAHLCGRAGQGAIMDRLKMPEGEAIEAAS